VIPFQLHSGRLVRAGANSERTSDELAGRAPR